MLYLKLGTVPSSRVLGAMRPNQPPFPLAETKKKIAELEGRGFRRPPAGAPRRVEDMSEYKGGQLLHPYFDDIDNEVWLGAEVVAGTPAGFRYFASPPGHWGISAKKRVAAHLKELNLPVLFSSNAGSRLSEIRSRLMSLHQKGGEETVRTHLREELTSIEADHKNSWVAAMYRAAVASDWFCNGGFLET